LALFFAVFASSSLAHASMLLHQHQLIEDDCESEELPLQHGEHTFYVNRSMLVKRDPDQVEQPSTPANSLLKTYSICSKYNNGCPARKTELHNWSPQVKRGRVIRTKLDCVSPSDPNEEKPHNHPPPPPKAVASKEVREEAKKALSFGVKPASVFRMLQTRFPDEPIQTPSQLRAARSLMKQQALPSDQRIQNLIGLFGKQLQFLKSESFFPQPLLPMATSFMTNQLLESGSNLFLIDTTFGLIEDDLKLTTLLVITAGGLYFPGFFLVHKYCDEESYTVLLQQALKATANKWNPRTMFGDFDFGETNAMRTVFPNCTFFGDLFHFLCVSLLFLFGC
jgi:hypothetical protein